MNHQPFEEEEQNRKEINPEKIYQDWKEYRRQMEIPSGFVEGVMDKITGGAPSLPPVIVHKIQEFPFVQNGTWLPYAVAAVALGFFRLSWVISTLLIP